MTTNQDMIDLLAAAIGILMSIVFEFAPAVKNWFGALGKFQKQLVFGGIGVLISAIAFGLNCAGIWATIFPTIVLACSMTGAFALVQVVIAVVGGAQVGNMTITKLLKLMSGK